MSVNFSKNQDEITKAWKEVVESTQESKWALFGYEGSTNIIQLMSSGSKGLNELVQEFNCSLIQYAFCRVIDTQTDLNKLVLINWQGESAPLSRKGLCASHVGDVANYFKGCSQTITIRNDDEATQEYLMEQIMKSSASRINLSRQLQSSLHNRTAINSNNRSENHASKNDVAAVLAADRKSFWKRQEEEEKERIAEEKRRAAEKQAQFERERKQREESESKKLAETIEQRDRLIDFTRQADRAGNHSQPNSIVTTEDDDSRVGRRSELIRLERNQETQSLISKGLIRNKRAIFEQQAQQAQQQRETQPTLTRRSSGAIISQRLNAFKSLDVSSTSTANDSVNTSALVGKLTNGFADKVSVSGDEGTCAARPEIKREIEKVQLVNDEDKNLSNGTKANDSLDSSMSKHNESSYDIHNGQSTSPEVINNSPKTTKNSQSDRRSSSTPDVNDNNEKQAADVSSTTLQPEHIDDEVDCEAIALFDYEAADNTEISFDPDDKIGHILKVDPGWWQGKVMSGRFKGQIGLFPSNYVKEI